MQLDFKQDLVLENNRVRLTPLSVNHINDLSHVVINNPDILKYSPPKFGTVDLLKVYVNTNVTLRENSQKYPFAIFDKIKEMYAGSTSYMNISQKDLRLEIGSTWIGKSFQRSGLNRNCKFLLMQYAFEVLRIERLEFKTDKRNIQSQTAIEAIGGRYEGLLRSHTVMSDGFRRDTVCYSILNNEWPAIKKSVFSQIGSK